MVRVFWRRVNFAEHFVAIMLDEQHFTFSRWSMHRHVRKETLTCACKIRHGLFDPHEKRLHLDDTKLDSGGRAAILNLYPLLCKWGVGTKHLHKKREAKFATSSALTAQQTTVEKSCTSSAEADEPEKDFKR